MKTNNRKVSITERVLEFFRSGSPLTFSETKRQMYGLSVNKKELSSKQLYDTVEKICKQGWLKKKASQDKIFFELTSKGRIKQMVFKLRTAKRQRGKQSTIIMFDIPEEKRIYRNFLRRILKQMKFVMIQKSVFIAPYILPKEFYDLLEEMDLARFVKVIEGSVRW